MDWNELSQDGITKLQAVVAAVETQSAAPSHKKNKLPGLPDVESMEMTRYFLARLVKPELRSNCIRPVKKGWRTAVPLQRSLCSTCVAGAGSGGLNIRGSGRPTLFAVDMLRRAMLRVTPEAAELWLRSLHFHVMLIVLQRIIGRCSGADHVC